MEDKIIILNKETDFLRLTTSKLLSQIQGKSTNDLDFLNP
jgi:hypothetical protein